MALLQHTCSKETKEWAPSYELVQTNLYQEKKITPTCNFKIVELIIDMIVYNKVNN